MAYSFELKVVGLDNLAKKFAEMPEKIQDSLDRTLDAASNAWVNGAVRDAPVYDGKLRNSITKYEEGPLNYKVVAGVFYAAYMEFGTKGKVKIPQGLEAYAATFRGKRGGSFKELLRSIEKWVKKNKIKETGGQKAKSVYSRGRNKRVKRKAGTYSAAAYWIALNIAKNGVKPHPFFFKQKQKAVNEISRGVADIYKQIKL